jgi:Domain of unknown function (DUF4265)
MNIVRHTAPAWREYGETAVAVRTPESHIEEIWVHKLPDDQMGVCCIPFFLYDVGLGDVGFVNSEGAFQVTKPNGRFIFRAWCERPEGGLSQLMDYIAKSQLLFETRGRLIAIDADEGQAQDLANVLDELERKGLLQFETGRPGRVRRT